MEAVIIVCGLCRATIPVDAPGDYVRHDLQVHGGLASMRSAHALLCAPVGDCICRLAEYEAIAGEVR